MKKFFGTFLCLVALGCGGSAATADRSAEGATMAGIYREGPGPKLIRAELCTAVDEERMRASSPPQTEFSPEQRVIYLVGKLKDVDEGTPVEVRWYLDADSEPQLVSNIEATENFSFIASYSPTEAKLFVGGYTVRVYVAGKEIASLPFSVRRADGQESSLTVRDLELGLKLDAQYHVPQPTTQFEVGTSSVHASFDVSGAEFGSVLTARWAKGDEVLHQEEISLSGDKRYTANVQTVGPMPRGSYSLELQYQGQVLVHRDFNVGNPNQASPKIQRTELGLGVGKDNQPKQKTNVFKKDASLLFLGVVFADVPPGATMEVSWIELSNEGDMTHYVARSVLPQGGDGTFGVTWEPKMMLEPGDYKAVVAVAGEPLAEVPFKVK